MITIHTQFACQPCRAVKRYLDKHGLPYREEPLTDASRARFQAAGILAAPVVELPGEAPFGGYAVSRLDAWRVKNTSS